MIDPVSPRAGTPLASGAAPRQPVPQLGTIRTATLPKLVSMAQELAAQGPPIDYAKISQLRQAMAVGAYRLDADRIAEALLGFDHG